jgi:ABC-type transport system involved in multi-copper enzyme maturation permease subunit
MKNKLHIWKALARGVLLDAVRRKDLWVVAILGFLIMACAGMLGFFGLNGLEVFAKDLAVTVLGIFSTIVAILTASRGMPEEIKNRTLYPLLARPITRFDLLFGKFIGATIATWIAFFVLSTLTAVALSIFHVQFEAIALQYLLLKMMGLAMLCAVSQTLSCYMTPQAAATMSFILAFGCSMLSRAFVLAYSNADPVLRGGFKFVNAVLPQYNLFDIGSRVSNERWAPVPLWVVGALAAYMAVYSSGMLMLSWAKFRKQAI